MRWCLSVKKSYKEKVKKLVYKLPKSIRIKLRLVYVLYGKKRHLDRDVEVEIDYGTLVVNPMTYIGCSIYNRGIYEPKTSKIIKNFLSEGMTSIDIGASNGVHSLRMAKCVGETGKVYAFEPSRERFDYLMKNININNVRNIIAENKGISNEHSFQNIKETGFVRMDNKKHDPVFNRAEIVTLDAYVKKNNLKDVDFIKIDTDGWEYKIISGAEEVLKKYKPVIIMEMRGMFFGNKTVEDLVLFLSNLGYRFFREDTLQEFISEESVIDEVSKNVKNVLCIMEKEE